MTPKAASGMFIMKMPLHPRPFTKIPPRGGPRPMLTLPAMAIAVSVTASRPPRRSARRKMAIPAGYAVALPNAWTQRSGTNHQNEGEKGASELATIRSTSPPTKTLRGPNESARYPATGIPIAAAR